MDTSTTVSPRVSKTLFATLAGALIACLSLTAQAQNLRDAHMALNAGNADFALAIVKPLARSGDAHAQTLLARMYAAGAGMDRNVGKAGKWFKRAVNRGDADALFHLAQMVGDAAFYQEVTGKTRVAEQLRRMGDANDLHQRARRAGSHAAIMADCAVASGAQATFDVAGEQRAEALAWCRVAPDFISFSASERGYIDQQLAAAVTEPTLASRARPIQLQIRRELTAGTGPKLASN